MTILRSLPSNPYLWILINAFLDIIFFELYSSYLVFLTLYHKLCIWKTVNKLF